jgi:hypothetical protein
MPYLIIFHSSPTSACSVLMFLSKAEFSQHHLHGTYLISVILEPLLTGEAVTDYLAESVNPTLLEGLAQLCKVKPADPVVWLADWLLMNNPNKPRTDEIITPTST